jgi:hypothetical protein
MSVTQKRTELLGLLHLSSTITLKIKSLSCLSTITFPFYFWSKWSHLICWDLPELGNSSEHSSNNSKLKEQAKVRMYYSLAKSRRVQISPDVENNHSGKEDA